MSSSARIDELRRKFDENPRRYFAPLANEYRKAGDFDQAIFICQEYLPQQPGHMSGHIVFGQALFEAKRLPEARTVFETALTLDPENLIALRHLADISRDLGDATAAKGWYERVLQADPRNEEIAAIMTTLTAQTASQGAPAVPIAPTEETPAVVVPAVETKTAAAVAPTVELSAAAVQEMLRARQAAQAAQAAASAPAEPVPELEMLSLDDVPVPDIHSVETVETPLVAAAESEAPLALEGFEATGHDEATGASERMDLPSGGMLGLEPTSAAGAETAPPAAAAPEGLDTLSLDGFSLPSAPPSISQPSAVSAPSGPDDGLMDMGSFEFGGGQTPVAEPKSEAAPLDLSIPAPAEIPDALDLDLDIPAPETVAASPPPPTVDSVPTVAMEAIPDVASPVIEPLDDVLPVVLDEIVPAVVEPAAIASTVIMEAIRVEPPKAEAPPPEEEAVAPTEVIDVTTVMKQIDAARQKKTESTAASATQPAAPKASPQAAPFVTETMAQLYLEQGHRAEAIDIYRQLIAARPDDAALRGRLEAIERAPQTPAPAEAVAPASAVPSASDFAGPATKRFSSDGPTIRSVLRELFGVDAMATHGNGDSNGAPGGEVGSIDTLFSADAVADAPNALAVAFDGGYVAASGTIDAIFTGGA